MTCRTRDSPGKLMIIKWSLASDLPIPDLSLSRSSTTQSTSSPTDVVNAAKPMTTMKTVVPIRAPTVVEEKSPYPMVVIEITLYQRLSQIPGASGITRSKKKKLSVLPMMLIARVSTRNRAPSSRRRLTLRISRFNE